MLLEGFIQQLAVAYVAHGYFFYVTGVVPEGKDPEAVDDKLLEKYGVRLSKFARYRRKALGQASVQYLRFGRFFVLIATHGKHLFFSDEKDGGEGERVKDIRRTPIRFAGYSVSCRRKTGDGSKVVAHVRMEQASYLEVRDTFLDLASKRSQSWLEYQFRNFPFEPYAPVRRQVVTIFARVNRVRREAGLEPLPSSCLRLKRKPARPFESVRESKAA